MPSAYILYAECQELVISGARAVVSLAGNAITKRPETGLRIADAAAGGRLDHGDVPAADAV